MATRKGPAFHLYLYGPDRGPIESSFEEAESRLAQLPLLHFEPDGSFVWIRDAGEQQIFGMIYDAGGRIQYCEIQGHCEYQTWKELHAAITGQSNPVIEVVRLPDQQLQELQLFEASLWPTVKSADHLKR